MCLKQTIGKKGEDIACKYLEENNYIIIERNFYCRQGEIDIIAKDCKTNELVFIEVKTRTNLNYGMPAEAVNEQKRSHIIKVAEYYIYKNKIRNTPIRFDVIEIFGSNFKLEHIKQAF